MAELAAPPHLKGDEKKKNLDVDPSRDRFIAKSEFVVHIPGPQNGRLFQSQRTLDAHAIQKVQHVPAAGRTFHLGRPPWRLAHGIDHISHPK